MSVYDVVEKREWGWRGKDGVKWLNILMVAERCVKWYRRSCQGFILDEPMQKRKENHPGEF